MEEFVYNLASRTAFHMNLLWLGDSPARELSWCYFFHLRSNAWEQHWLCETEQGVGISGQKGLCGVRKHLLASWADCTAWVETVVGLKAVPIVSAGGCPFPPSLATYLSAFRWC